MKVYILWDRERNIDKDRLCNSGWSCIRAEPGVYPLQGNNIPRWRISADVERPQDLLGCQIQSGQQKTAGTIAVSKRSNADRAQWLSCNEGHSKDVHTSITIWKEVIASNSHCNISCIVESSHRLLHLEIFHEVLFI